MIILNGGDARGGIGYDHYNTVTNEENPSFVESMTKKLHWKGRERMAPPATRVGKYQGK